MLVIRPVPDVQWWVTSLGGHAAASGADLISHQTHLLADWMHSGHVCHVLSWQCSCTDLPLCVIMTAASDLGVLMHKHCGAIWPQSRTCEVTSCMIPVGDSQTAEL